MKIRIVIDVDPANEQELLEYVTREDKAQSIKEDLVDSYPVGVFERVKVVVNRKVDGQWVKEESE